MLVLTVDPARRLADALGVGDLGNVATRVPAAAFESIGVAPRGELWAAMLDTKAGWDELIRRHAPTAEIRDVGARPTRSTRTSPAASCTVTTTSRWSSSTRCTRRATTTSSIVDTPPSRNALDVLDAPSRMVEFFGSRLLHWLTVPYRSRLFNLASKPFNQIADRVLGSRFLQDIAEFFILFQAMERGFVARAREVEALLGDPRTTFVVVTTLEAAPAHEAGYLVRELAERQLPASARSIANRVMPPALTSRAAASSAERLADAPSRRTCRHASPRALARPKRGAGDRRRRRVVADVLAEVADELPRCRPRRHAGGGAARRARRPGAAGARRRGAAERRARRRRSAGDRRHSRGLSDGRS